MYSILVLKTNPYSFLIYSCLLPPKGKQHCHGLNWFVGCFMWESKSLN